MAADVTAERLPADADAPMGDRVGLDRGRPARWSTRVFWAAIVVALPLLLWFGRGDWFFLDDWWVLAGDGLARPGLLEGHNGHWITVVRLVHWASFEVWGLHSYLPYQVPVVLAHLGATVLVRQVILRLGVREWIAASTALAFLFFGSGRENILWGHEVGQTGSVVCGLALLLLTDGRGSVTRRDWLALGVGLVGLMTSGMFVGYLAGVGVAVLIRRGVRIAAFYAVPLGAVYAAWYTSYAHADESARSPAGATIRYGGRMLWATVDAAARGPQGAVVLAAAALGLGVAVHQAWRSETWAAAATPLGLAVGWAAFAGLTASARAWVSADDYDSERYLYASAALVLPLAAAGVEHLARRRALVGAAALVPLAVGLPGNFTRLQDPGPFRSGNPQFVFAMAHSPFLGDVPPDTPVFGNRVRTDPGIPLTTGWLSRQVAAGRIPEPDGSEPVQDFNATIVLALRQAHTTADHGGCPPLTDPVPVTLRAGDRIGFTGTISLSATDGAQESARRRFSSRTGSEIEVTSGPIDVVVRRVMGGQAQACIPDAEGGPR